MLGTLGSDVIAYNYNTFSEHLQQSVVGQNHFAASKKKEEKGGIV